MEKDRISTVYIMSKGRPACATAQMLTDIGYPGEWFIVCGDNDDTLPQYRERWGEKKVLVFDWKAYVEKTDLLDPFGVDNGKPSGAAPARNAIRDLSAGRGEERHWQFDDDFPIFYDIDDRTGRKIRIEDGTLLYGRLWRIAKYGHDAGLLDIGVDGATLFVDAESRRKVARQVFCCHNLRSDDKFLPWRGRVADDIVQALDTARNPLNGIQLSIKWFGYAYEQSAKNEGGNTDLYLSEGYIRKAGYAILVSPSSCKVRIDAKGPHIRMSYPQPKIIHEFYQR